jgi:hypothetical protein
MASGVETEVDDGVKSASSSSDEKGGVWWDLHQDVKKISSVCRLNEMNEH